MKRQQSPLIGLLAVLGATALTYAQTPVGSGFTYQGQLKSGGAPYTGTADMQFTLYDAAVAGNIVAGPIASGNVQVANGLFTTTLDFGASAFNGEARWLQIAVVTPAGGSADIPLSPRQPIRPAPYALKVPGIDGHSLDAVDGAPADAVYVNGDGYVGIGTTSPECRLHVEATQEVAVYGSNMAATGNTFGLLGRCLSPDGKAVCGIADAESGIAYGGYFESRGTDGVGVYGRAPAETGFTYGVSGVSNSQSGRGVAGIASASSGQTYGAFGRSYSTSGRGVHGEALASSGATCGVRGESYSPDGSGVCGINRAGSGPGYGGQFTADGDDGIGVEGVASALNGTGYGGKFLAASPTGVGVYGGAMAADGKNAGVRGVSDSSSGYGVHGVAWGNGGIAGRFENATGNFAPALQTIGDAVVQGQDWPSGGAESCLYLGDSNHCIKSVAGQGVRIGTYGGVDLVRLQQWVALVGIDRTPTANKLEVEGNASKTTAGSWLANSDARIKTDVQTVANALDTLDKVRLVSFRYTDEYRCEHPGIADRQYVNVVAQEFAEVFPDYVQASGEQLPDGGEILQVDPYPLTVYSAAAVQELHAVVKQKDAQIAAQQAQIAALQEQDTRLAARVAALEQLVARLVHSGTGE